MKCPKCQNTVLTKNINIQTDIAKCDTCDHIFKISESFVEINSMFDINNKPNGTWYNKDFNTTTLGATTRSLIAFFLIPFMIVWSGGALGGIYGTQIFTGKFDLFQSLFGIPFIIGAIVFWTVTLMAICGKVEIIFDNNGGKVFTGIGKIGRTKNFIWKEIASINEGKANFRYSGSHGSQIIFEGKNRMAFGTGLKDERRYYLLQSLRKIHSQLNK